MAGNKLTATLQENLITLIAYSVDSGRIAANIVDPALFEGEYRVIAERICDYWHKFDAPPGDHTPDLFAEILEDSHNKRGPTYKRILSNMLALSASINSVYVIDQLRTFTRLQQFKIGILKSAEQINARQEMALEEVEQILNDLLRTRSLNFERGTRLADVDKLIESISASVVPEFSMGIREFDRAGVIPARGTAILFIGPKGTGKSWFCIHIGKQALLRRKRVLHISLEMSEEQVQKRYYQSLYNISKRDSKVRIPSIQRNSLGKIDSIEFEDIQSEFTLSGTTEELYEEFKSRALWMGARLNNLIIKRFPTRELTPAKLEAYLDALESVDGFMPDLVALDYLGLMHTNADNHRISLGRTFEDLRGLSIKRNFALVAPHQSHRAGASAAIVSSSHVAEDWSLVGTADVVVTITKTEQEKRLGLARLWLSHSREETDAFGVLITQSYDIGQFAIDSIMLGSEYSDRLKELSREGDVDDDAKDEDD